MGIAVRVFAILEICALVGRDQAGFPATIKLTR
jgi:hypothetical protein